MPLLLFVARAFIQTFGITQPTLLQERRAAWFIAGLSGAIVLAVIVAFLAFALR